MCDFYDPESPTGCESGSASPLQGSTPDLGSIPLPPSLIPAAQSKPERCTSPETDADSRSRSEPRSEARSELTPASSPRPVPPPPPKTSVGRPEMSFAKSPKSKKTAAAAAILEAKRHIVTRSQKQRSQDAEDSKSDKKIKISFSIKSKRFTPLVQYSDDEPTVNDADVHSNMPSNSRDASQVNSETLTGSEHGSGLKETQPQSVNIDEQNLSVKKPKLGGIVSDSLNRTSKSGVKTVDDDNANSTEKQTRRSKRRRSSRFDQPAASAGAGDEKTVAEPSLSVSESKILKPHMSKEVSPLGQNTLGTTSDQTHSAPLTNLVPHQLIVPPHKATSHHTSSSQQIVDSIEEQCPDELLEIKETSLPSSQESQPEVPESAPESLPKLQSKHKISPKLGLHHILAPAALGMTTKELKKTLEEELRQVEEEIRAQESRKKRERDRFVGGQERKSSSLSLYSDEELDQPETSENVDRLKESNHVLDERDLSRDQDRSRDSTETERVKTDFVPSQENGKSQRKAQKLSVDKTSYETHAKYHEGHVDMETSAESLSPVKASDRANNVNSLHDRSRESYSSSLGQSFDRAEGESESRLDESSILERSADNDTKSREDRSRSRDRSLDQSIEKPSRDRSRQARRTSRERSTERSSRDRERHSRERDRRERTRGGGENRSHDRRSPVRTRGYDRRSRERERSRDRDRDQRDRRSRERSKDRHSRERQSKDRDSLDRSRDGSRRSRERRGKSSDRSRDRRSRDRTRDKRSPERQKSRRSRERKSRDRSYERPRERRSRERSRGRRSSDRTRDRRSTERLRARDRSKDRRSVERSRNRRSADRSRDQRSVDRTRDRRSSDRKSADRSWDRRSSERSRERKSQERSRDRRSSERFRDRRRSRERSKDRSRERGFVEQPSEASRRERSNESRLDRRHYGRRSPERSRDRSSRERKASEKPHDWETHRNTSEIEGETWQHERHRRENHSSLPSRPLLSSSPKVERDDSSKANLLPAGSSLSEKPGGMQVDTIPLPPSSMGTHLAYSQPESQNLPLHSYAQPDNSGRALLPTPQYPPPPVGLVNNNAPPTMGGVKAESYLPQCFLSPPPNYHAASTQHAAMPMHQNVPPPVPQIPVGHPPPAVEPHANLPAHVPGHLPLQEGSGMIAPILSMPQQPSGPAIGHIPPTQFMSHPPPPVPQQYHHSAPVTHNTNSEMESVAMEIDYSETKTKDPGDSGTPTQDEKPILPIMSQPRSFDSPRVAFAMKGSGKGKGVSKPLSVFEEEEKVKKLTPLDFGNLSESVTASDSIKAASFTSAMQEDLTPEKQAASMSLNETESQEHQIVPPGSQSPRGNLISIIPQDSVQSGSGPSLINEPNQNVQTGMGFPSEAVLNSDRPYLIGVSSQEVHTSSSGSGVASSSVDLLSSQTVPHVTSESSEGHEAIGYIDKFKRHIWQKKTEKKVDEEIKSVSVSELVSEAAEEETEDKKEALSKRRRSSRIKTREERKNKDKSDEVDPPGDSSPSDGKDTVDSSQTLPDQCQEQRQPDDAMLFSPPQKPPPDEMLSPSVLPMKVKSRWRRCSELEITSSSSEAHGTTSEFSSPEPPKPEPSSFATPPPPLPVTSQSPDSKALQVTTQFKAAKSPVSSALEILAMAKRKAQSVAESVVSEQTIKEEVVEEEEAPVFEPIVDNICLHEKKKTKARKEARRMVCDCDPPGTDDEDAKACGEDCLNRMLMVECGSRCACGDLCTNKRFQRHQYAETEIFRTSWKGWGLKTSTDLTKGTFVLEYVGEVCGYNEFNSRSRLYAKESQKHFYFMALNADEIIDATRKGNVSRFINHSCEPNCETQKWTVNGQLRVGFFTVRDVKEGEELTFDYQFEQYGKEAQKCFCGSENCRGTIGTAKEGRRDTLEEEEEEAEEELEGQEEEKKNRAKKKMFDDVILEEALEKLGGDGMRTRRQVLEVARLMVRAESIQQRTQLLQFIQATKEPACLRLFLDYHGLSLLWSWMLDINNSALTLKIEVLKTLKALPISNLTILNESKVLSVVERWSREIPSTTTATPTPITTESDRSSQDHDSEACSTPQAGEPPSDVSTPDAPLPHKKRRLLQRLTAAEEASSSDGEMWENGASKMGVISKEGDTEMKSLLEEYQQLLEQLLASWKDLKEVFKIPKKQVAERKRTEQELESRKRGYVEPEWIQKARDDKRRKTMDDPDDRGIKTRRMGVLLRGGSTPNKLSKHERRQQFEAKVRAEEEQKAREQQDQGGGEYYGHSDSTTAIAAPVQFYEHTAELPVAPPTQQVLVSGGSTVLPTSLPQHVMDPQQQQPAHYVDPNTQHLLLQQAPSQQYQAPSGPSLQQQQYEAAAAQYLSGNQGAPAAQLVQAPQPHLYYTTTQTAPVSTPQSTQLVLQHVPQRQPAFPHPVLQLIQTDVPAASAGTVQPQAMQHIPPAMPQVAANTQVAAPQIITHQQLPAASTTMAAPQRDPREPPPPPPSPPPKPKLPRLPPNWKVARDAEGKEYYYHTVTRQTQWDPPSWDVGGEDSDSMDLGTPGDDDQRRQKTTTAAADTSSENAKKIKDQFRSKIAKHIVTCLGPYRKPDCKFGRITSTDDFKHLARKITHAVLDKELKSCRHLEDLEVNENVKGKAKEYVKKYMCRFGSVYRKTSSP